MNEIRGNWLEGLAELREGDLAIAVQVEATNDCDEFGLKWLVTHPLQEDADASLSERLMSMLIDSLEESSQAEALATLELLLQLLKVNMELEFRF